MRTFTLFLLITCHFAGCCAQTPSPAPTHIIDTHIHIYDTARPQGVPWPGKNDAVLYKPHMPADFRLVAEANGVDAAVIVEASEWVDDNQWLLDLTKDDALFKAIVGNLLPGDESFAKNLERFAKDKRFVGIRPRVPQNVKVTDEKYLADLAKLAAKNLTLDMLTHSATLDDIRVIAEKVPQLTIIVDHVGGVPVDGNAPDPKWVAQIQALAKHRNVYCKVSGMSQQSPVKPAPMTLAYYKPTLDVIWNAFGEDRLIFASNWPVIKMGGNYEEELRITKEYFEPKGRDAVEKVFWKNACAAYGLKF